MILNSFSTIVDRNYDISTFEFNYRIKKLNLFGEIGVGSYESSNVERSSGEAITSLITKLDCGTLVFML